MTVVMATTTNASDAKTGDSECVAAERFGHDVLGPIFVEFAQRLWMFQHVLPGSDDACLLFCARGGLRLRVIYENFLARTGLQAPLPYNDLMISRLVAARTSIGAPGRALIDELGREFEGQTMAEVAVALSQEPALARDSTWAGPFDPEAFVALLDRNTPDVARLCEIIGRLDASFRRHLEAVSDGRKTIVLCDTGLYGSTVRLLLEGMPDKRWCAAQFARSNYKGFATPHFDVTIGLSVERDGYAPWNVRTTALRFWHLIESVLEPDLASVRTFTDEPQPRANLQIPGWQDRVADSPPGLFTGVLAYLHELSPADLPTIGTRAESAWRMFRRSVIWPQPQDVSALTLSARARDFGRTEAVQQFSQKKPVRGSLWREGALIQYYPRLGRVALVGLEIAHIFRTLRKIGNRWSTTKTR